MSVRTSLRLGTALLGLTLVAAACNGAAGTTANGGPGANLGSDNGTAASDPGAVAPASPEPTFDLGSLLSPDPTPDTTPASTPGAPAAPSGGTQPTPKPPATNPPVISTSQASSLLSQVDHLLNEMNSELSNADAAASNPGE